MNTGQTDSNRSYVPDSMLDQRNTRWATSGGATCAARDAGGAGCAGHASASLSATPPLDVQQLLDRCLGNVEFVDRVLTKFHERFSDDLEQLERERQSGAGEAVASLAHRLKGSAANVAAPELQRISAQLEELGRLQRMAEIPECLEGLRREWSRFVDYSASLPRPLPIGRPEECRKEMRAD